MRASVIIPAYNAERSIGPLLAALSRQTLPRDRFEVLVIDDGSPDGTAAVAESGGARVLRQQNRGPAAARNYGAREAKGEVLVFTDSDCEPEPDFLERLLSPFEDPRVIGAKGAYLSRQRELTARFVQVEYEEKYDRMAKEQEARGGIDFIDTYAAAFRRESLLAAGGFDETFPSASVEDQELSFRLAEIERARSAETGRPPRIMRFVPEARVFHLHVASLRGYARKKWKIGYWKVAVLRRHPGKAVRDSHTPQILKLQMLLVPLPPLFLLTTVPFILRALRRDLAVALAAPLFLYVRALALGLGLVAGIVRGVALPAEPARVQTARERV